MEQRDLLRGVPKPHPLYMPEPIKEQFLKVLCLYFLLSCLLPDLIAEFGTPAQAEASACVRRQNLVESPDISTPPALVEEMTTAEDDEDVPEH